MLKPFVCEVQSLIAVHLQSFQMERFTEQHLAISIQYRELQWERKKPAMK